MLRGMCSLTALPRRVAKGADLLAVNAVGERLGFGDVPNSIVILDNRGYEVARVEGSKIDVARVLIDLVASRLSD